MKTTITLFTSIEFFFSVLDFIIMEKKIDMENISTLDSLQES